MYLVEWVRSKSQNVLLFQAKWVVKMYYVTISWNNCSIFGRCKIQFWLIFPNLLIRHWYRKLQEYSNLNIHNSVQNCQNCSIMPFLRVKNCILVNCSLQKMSQFSFCANFRVLKCIFFDFAILEEPKITI